MLELTKYIKSHPNWEIELTEKPYCITIKRDDNFIMFNYSQIDSDFFNPIVKESRGIILDSKFNTVCVPFYKFGNYGEGYADEIDWSTAKVQEKVDGSLIKVWNYNGGWGVSTNGTINASNAELGSDVYPYRTFYDLFIEAARLSNLHIEELEPNYTYMFELTSPYNRVVVPYNDISIRHIGTRNINTLQEYNVDIGIPKPRMYDLHSLNDCVASASQMPFREEGYVVVDKNWHRVKVKSPAYIAVHKLKNNGAITTVKILDLILINEECEFLTYYPEFTKMFDDVKDSLNTFIENMDKEILTAKQSNFNSRKEFASFAKQTKCPALMFNWYDNFYQSAREWIYNQTADKIVKWISQDEI